MGGTGGIAGTTGDGGGSTAAPLGASSGAEAGTAVAESSAEARLPSAGNEGLRSGSATGFIAGTGGWLDDRDG